MEPGPALMGARSVPETKIKKWRANTRKKLEEMWRVRACRLVDVLHAERYLGARHRNDFDPDLQRITGIQM